MGPPFQTAGNLSGLNLSLNHGLDLTSPTYGCLNLTQSAMGQQGNRGDVEGGSRASMGLNLTASQNAQPHEQNYQRSVANNPSTKKAVSSAEVGLNLSLQNGMDLTRQTYYYDSSGHAGNGDGFQYRPDGHYEQHQENHVLIDTSHQNSPLNLENHRSSPLNLTQNQYFSFSTHNYSASTNGSSSSYNPYYYHHQPQQYTDYSQQNIASNSQQNAKIRLFCQSCSQEFATSNELNKHMEKHNHQLNSMCNSQSQQALQTLQAPAENQNWNSHTEAMNFTQNKLATKGVSSEPVLVATSTVTVSNNSSKKQSCEEPLSSCTECELHFPTGIDLKKHIDLAHQGRQGAKKYQCLQCLAEFDDTKSHKIHVEAHALEKPFKCDKCGLHLSNASGLRKHVRRVHEKSGPTYQCSVCSKSFFDKFDLSRHTRTHTEKPRCDKCGDKIKSTKLEKKHTCKPAAPDVAKDPELQCTVCGVYLETKVRWGFHMWKHTKNPAYIQTKPTASPSLSTSQQPLCLKSN